MRPTDVEHAFAKVNGIRMHYAPARAGSPVFLLHGWPQTWYCSRKLIPLLAARHTVVAPDLRGCGLSDAEADDASYEAGARLRMPVLVLWDSEGLARRLPALEIWRDYAPDAESGPIDDCGHFLPEEQPEAVAERLLDFLG